MAILNINILTPVIDLISNNKELSNSCKSIFTFDIVSTDGAQISIFGTEVEGNTEGFDKVEYNYNGTWITIPPVSKQYDSGLFFLDSSGKAQVRLAIGNVENMPYTECNKGGITITDHTNNRNEYSQFSRCITDTRCEAYVPPVGPPPVIEPDTNIRIYFDASGSMDDTLPPLERMKAVNLKNRLMSKYDNNETTYNSKVKIIMMNLPGGRGSLYENPYSTLNYDGGNLVGKVISMVFMDEAEAFADPEKHEIDPANYPNLTETSSHRIELGKLRTRLGEFPQNYYRGVLFQVQTPLTGGYSDNDLEAFRAYVQHVKNGDGVYAGTNGLSDKPEIIFDYNVTPGTAFKQPGEAFTETELNNAAEYYTDLVVNILNDFGFNIT